MKLVNLSLKRMRPVSLLLIIVSFFVTACSNSTPNQPAVATAVGSNSSTTAGNTFSNSSSGTKTKVVFWSNQRHDQNFMRAQVEQFNRENRAGIELEYRILGDDYANLMQLAWQSNDAPDVFFTRAMENVPTLVKDGYIEPLDSYVTPQIKEQIGQANFIEGMTVYNGKLYSLPAFAYTYRLIYNKELFKKAGLISPPTTLDELVADAKKLTAVGKANGAYGFAIHLKTPTNSWNRTLTPVATRSGFRDYNYTTGQFDFSVDKPILQAFRQIVVDGSMFPGYELLDIDPLRSQFAAGKIGMYMSLSAEVQVYASQFKPVMEWAAAPVPTVDGQVKSGSLLGRSDWLAMNARSKNKAAAWQVIQWFYRPEFLIKYQEGGYGNLVLPGLAKIAKAPTEVGSSYFLPDFKNVDAVWPNIPTVSKIEGKDYSSLFAEYVIGTAPDLDKLLNDLTVRYNKALARNIADSTIQKVLIPDFDPAKLKAK